MLGLTIAVPCGKHFKSHMDVWVKQHKDYSFNVERV